MLLRAVVAACLALALAACGGGGSGTTTQASNLPPGCTGPEVQAIVKAFLTHPTVAPPAMFRSYSEQESDGRTFKTTSGPAAVAHARARLRLGERDRLLQLQLDPVDINHVHIVFSITRSAPDFLGRGIHNRIANGSGIVDCAHGKIAAWSVKGP